MKRGFTPIILALALAGVAAAVPASWRARYDKLERVYAAKDMAGLSALCAKDLVWVQVDGTKKNRAETLAEFAGMFQSDKVRVHEKLLSVKKNGNTVDVSCEVFAVFSVKGKPDARMHSFCVDSWQKMGGKWQIVKTVDTKVEMTGG